jgi:DNA polymerase III alpha subunit
MAWSVSFCPISIILQRLFSLYEPVVSKASNPYLGIEFRQDNEFLYLGIARNDEGWRELCSLLTESSLTGEPLPKEAPELQHCYIIYRKLPKGVELLRDYEYAGVRPEEVNHLYSSYLKNYPDKLVIFSPVTFADQDGFKAHKLLRCIDLNIVIGKLDAKDCAKSSEIFYPKGHLENVFQQYPHIIANTQHILDNLPHRDGSKQISQSSYFYR